MTRLRIFGSLALGLSFILPAFASAAPPVSGARFFGFGASVEPESGPSLNLGFTLHRDGLSVHDVTERAQHTARRIVRSVAPPGVLAAFRRTLTDNQIGRQVGTCRLEEAVPLGGRIVYSFCWIQADGQFKSFRAHNAFVARPCPAVVSRLIAASLAFVRAQESRAGAVIADFPDPETPTGADSILAAAGPDRRLLVGASIFKNDTLFERSDSVGAYVFRDGLVVSSLTSFDNRFSRIEYTRGQATPAEMAQLTASLASGRVGQLTSCSLYFDGNLKVKDSYAWAGLGTRTNQFLASTESTEAACPSALDGLNDSIARIEALVKSHPDSWVVFFIEGS